MDRTDRRSEGEAGIHPRCTEIERSAGGVVIDRNEVVVVVPRRRAADGSKVLGLPKGHVDPCETALAAAIREVREEAGVEVQHVAPLGEVRYCYRSDRREVAKIVVFHLFRYLEGDPANHDEEIEEAFWMPLQEAAHALTYDGERQILERAMMLVGASPGAPPASPMCHRLPDQTEDR